nr:cytidine deaminase [uncultured Treponema sp.]
MKNSSKYEYLFEQAMEAAKNAYAPYSHFRVGAALLLDDGCVVTGVNVENRSYGLTNCAERTAVFSAVAMGKKNFTAIAIATPDADYPVGPCGACRQVISEFMKPEAPVIFGSSAGNRIETTVSGIYPFDSLHELQQK